MKVTVIPFVFGALGAVSKRLVIGNNSDYRIVEIGTNTAKSPEDQKRFAITQTAVKATSNRWYEKQGVR